MNTDCGRVAAVSLGWMACRRRQAAHGGDHGGGGEAAEAAGGGGRAPPGASRRRRAGADPVRAPRPEAIDEPDVPVRAARALAGGRGERLPASRRDSDGVRRASKSRRRCCSAAGGCRSAHWRRPRTQFRAPTRRTSGSGWTRPKAKAGVAGELEAGAGPSLAADVQGVRARRRVSQAAGSRTCPGSSGGNRAAQRQAVPRLGERGHFCFALTHLYPPLAHEHSTCYAVDVAVSLRDRPGMSQAPASKIRPCADAPARSTAVGTRGVDRLPTANVSETNQDAER